MNPAVSLLRRPHFLFDLALFIAAWVAYVSTLTPSVLAADSGELQLVAWKLGIAHPPGYPLYTLVGFLLLRFFASPAYALNLLSAILAAMTLVLVSRTVRAISGSSLAGIAAAGILGTSTSFWSQATTANIRMPTALFTAWCVYELVMHRQAAQLRDAGAARARLTRFALAFSLGLGHHLSLLFPGVLFVAYLFLSEPDLIRQPRRWVAPGLIFLVGLSALLYLPIRGATGGTFADGESAGYLAQPGRLLDHILARGFEGDFFYFVNTRPDLLGDRLALLPTLFSFQFSIGAFILAVVGICRCLFHDRRLLLLLAGGIAMHTFVTLAYRAPQTVEYMMPAYVLLAVLIGYGVGGARTAVAGQARDQGTSTPIFRRSSWIRPAVLLFAVVTSLARAFDSFPAYMWLSQNEDARSYAESLLTDAPLNATILSNWHCANPLWYLQQVENLRRDVNVLYVFPRGEELAISWLKEIDKAVAAGRPAVVNMYFREEFAASPFIFEPISREAFQVRRQPLSSLPGRFSPPETDWGGGFSLLGYDLPAASTRPGEPLTVFLAWRIETRPDRDYSVFVHLVDSSGRVIGQSDLSVPADRYQRGDVIVERFFVAPLPDTAPGEYDLVAGVYTVENGRIRPLANQVKVARTTIESPQPISPPPAGATALSHGIYFLDASSDPRMSQSVAPGDRLVIDLRFFATRPLTRDFIVSVQMIGAENSWKAVSDSVPALGAIPTLKWIAGSSIVDRHVIDVPANATSGPASVSLILYDHFTQQPLALLDARLAQHGPSIPLGSWFVAPP